MLNTETYGLNLPEAGDQYNVDDMNENTTKIDTAMNEEATARALADEEINKTIAPITKEQIDNLFNFPADSVTELNDVRRDVNGTVHMAAGEAVRSQVRELKNDLGELESLFDNVYNLVDESKIQLNHYYNIPWKPNDQPYAEGWRCVEVMVEPNTAYSVFGINMGLTWFSDSNYSNLGQPETNNGNVTTPDGCDRMCISTNLTDNICVINKPDLPIGNYKYGLIYVNIPKFDLTKNEQYVTDKNDYLSFKNGIINNSYTNISVFQDIGIIGDSFASGGIYGISGVTDNAYYDISWGAILGRRNGITPHIYSAPGFSTRTWLSNADMGLEKALSDIFTGLYLLCLGINDSWIVTSENYLGTIDDIKEDYNNNPDTFYGNYAKIYEQLKEHSPNSKFIFITPPESTSADVVIAIHNIANHYNIPIIDSWGDDEYFSSEFYLNNHSNAHPNAVAYAGMAQAYERMIVKCIESNKDYFFNYCGV